MNADEAEEEVYRLVDGCCCSGGDDAGLPRQRRLYCARR